MMTSIYLFYRKKGGKKESVAALATANAKVWEARLTVADISKNEFR